VQSVMLRRDLGLLVYSTVQLHLSRKNNAYRTDPFCP
jgi:hypothetical protein